MFKYVSGKEDELIAWIVWPLFKVENDVKSVNTGIFSPKLFKKPAQKPPFGEKKNILDMQLNFVSRFFKIYWLTDSFLKIRKLRLLVGKM